MTEWTPEATDYLEGYLQMVGALARAQGEDADDITAGLREHINAKLEESAGPIITLDALRRVLAEVGSPEQILATPGRSAAPERPAPAVPAPPYIPQYTPAARPDSSVRALRWIIVLAVTFVLVIFILPILGIGAAILLPALARAHEAANRATCQNNLQQIGLACMMFAEENQGAWPESLDDLHPEYLTDPSVFLCPSSKNKVGNRGSVTAWTSYEYIPGYQEGQAEQVVVCRDKEWDFHIPGGKNILYSDGNVTFVRETVPPATTIRIPDE
jgi:hypothetical protein